LKRQQNQTAGDEYPLELVEHLSQMSVGYVDDRIPCTDPADAVVRDAEIRHRSYSELQSRIEPLRFINHVGRQVNSNDRNSAAGQHGGGNSGPAAHIDDSFVVTLQDQASECAHHRPVDRLVIEVVVEALSVGSSGAVVTLPRQGQKVVFVPRWALFRTITA
jgi:hypothetical protein